MGAGAGVGGVVIAVPEAGDVAGVADEHRRDDRSHPEELGERGAGGRDSSGDARLGGAHLGIEAAQIVEVLKGERVASALDRALGLDPRKRALGVGSVDLVGDPARHELGQ
jgi:hypothetical protein